MADRILNIGFIGNGKGSNRYHAPFSLALPEKFRIKTMQARHLGGPWPKIPGVEYTTDMAAMLADPEIDIVEISTPHNTHYSLTKAALEAGKHVVCDKAFVGTVAEAEELYALAEAKGVTVQCYQNRRFDSDFLTAKKVMESGKLGKVFEIVTHYDYWRAEYATPATASTSSSAGWASPTVGMLRRASWAARAIPRPTTTLTCTTTSWASRPRLPPTTTLPSSVRALRSMASAVPSSRWRRTSKSATSRSSTCLRDIPTLAWTRPSSGESCATTTTRVLCTRSV